MKSTVAVISPTSNRLLLDIASQFNGSTELITGTAAYDILVAENFTNTDFEQKLIFKLTIDTFGTINIVNIRLEYLGVLAGVSDGIKMECKLQISGDGGITWVNITDTIVSNNDTIQKRAGPGLWISSIDTGTEKLQIRLVARSTDETPVDLYIRSESHIYIIYNKTVF